MIYVGLDDTDVVGSPGTNQLARAIVQRLGPTGSDAIICRHQLFFDPRVPYTSKNGSASIQLPHGDGVGRETLIETVREVMRAWFVEGSDPGLAVSAVSSPEMTAFAARAKTDVVTQQDARDVAARSRCYLEGLGGTEQGVIGALAAIALVAGGNDGRVVHLGDWPYPDPFSGPQDLATIIGRGVTDVRSVAGEPFTGGSVDVGKHLRPNWRDGRVVLFVEPVVEATPAWRAVRLD